MAMDLERNRYLDFADLERYCHRVAGVVGLMSAEIFGYTNPATRDYARDLGIAFQLTNIIRDVGEDARRGRIYLPQDELARHGVTAVVAAAAPGERRVSRADGRPGRRAPASGTSARSPRCPPRIARAQRPGLIMAAIYRTLLDEIVRDGYARARPPDRAHAAAQALDRVEDSAPPLTARDAPQQPHVAVVGGGWAGCAAAVDAREGRRPRRRCSSRRDRSADARVASRSTASRSTTASTC